jgi:1,4-alpha-glucan branching enzyme
MTETTDPTTEPDEPATPVRRSNFVPTPPARVEPITSAPQEDLPGAARHVAEEPDRGVDESATLAGGATGPTGTHAERATRPWWPT